jgi:hypothetical protein
MRGSEDGCACTKGLLRGELRQHRWYGDEREKRELTGAAHANQFSENQLWEKANV